MSKTTELACCRKQDSPEIKFEGSLIEDGPLANNLPTSIVRLTTDLFRSSIDTQVLDENEGISFNRYFVTEQDENRVSDFSSPKSAVKPKKYLATESKMAQMQNDSYNLKTPTKTNTKSCSVLPSTNVTSKIKPGSTESKKRKPIQPYEIQLSANSNMSVEAARKSLSPMLKGLVTDRHLDSSNSNKKEFGGLRLNLAAKQIEEHKKILRKVFFDQDMTECTFTPRISSRSQTPRRNLSKFLESQTEFVNKIQQKTKNLRDSLNQSVEKPTYKPQLSERTYELAEKKRNQTSRSKDKSIYEQLYEIGTKENLKRVFGSEMKQVEEIQSVNSSKFIGDLEDLKKVEPKTKKTKEDLRILKKITTQNRPTLYDDALRRQKKQAELDKSKSRQLSTSKISNQSKKQIALRFIKEYDLNIANFIDKNTDKIKDYITLNEFLTRMNFLKNSNDSKNPFFNKERLLLFDLWLILHGDERKGVHRRNLLVALLAVLGLHYEITKIQEPTENSTPREEDLEMVGGSSYTLIKETTANKEKKNIGQFDDAGNFEIDADGFKKINQMFKMWEYNRLNSPDIIGGIISSRYKIVESHKPEINRVSSELALKRREKVIQNIRDNLGDNYALSEANNRVSLNNYLIATQSLYNHKIDEKKMVQESASLIECTFKPQTIELNTQILTPRAESKNKSTPNNLGKARTSYLYNLSKAVKSPPKTKEEKEYELNADECTFQPNIQITQYTKISKEKIANEIKGVGNITNRYKSARDEKMEKINSSRRGFTRGDEKELSFTKNTVFSKKDTIQNVTSLNSKIKQRVPINPYLLDKGSQYKFDKEDAPASSAKSLITEKGKSPVDDANHSIQNYVNSENPIKENGVDKIPLLHIDVDLGNGRSERLTIHQGESLDKIAYNFCKSQGLDRDVEEKLKNLLRIKMKEYLVEIEEEVNIEASEDNSSKS